MSESRSVPFLPSQRRVALRAAIVLMLALFFWFMPPSANADDAVRVTGTDGTTQTWSIARLRETLSAEVKTVEYTSRDQKHTCSGVPLLAVLKASGITAALKMDPKAGPHVKNYNLRLAVVVQGGDGYTATFSFGELMPEIGGREAWLAFDEDGKPLSDRNGPVKLVVPTDQKPARWVRNVTAITVTDPAATTRPTTREAGR